MRAPFLMLPIALALAAPLPGIAGDSARVLFCSGDCYAVDAKGVRTPAPKGTQLLPGQRLETGLGSYAQVKLGSDAAFGVGENARVRLDGDNGIFLDHGRIRVVGGEALGQQTTRPVELRTDDSTFVLRGADLEMKKSGPTGPAAPIMVKLNAGDASVSGAALANGGVQLVTGGSVIPGAPLPATEVARATPGKSTGPLAQAGGLPDGVSPLPPRMAPIALPPLSVSLPPVARGPVVPPTLTLPPVLRRMPLPPVVQPSPLPRGTLLLAAPVINTRTGDIMTLDSAIRLTVDPTISVKTLNTTLLTSPTLSTSTLSTTTLRDSTVLTTTKLSTTTTIAPTTEFKLLSPTLTTFR